MHLCHAHGALQVPEVSPGSKGCKWQAEAIRRWGDKARSQHSSHKKTSLQLSLTRPAVLWADADADVSLHSSYSAFLIPASLLQVVCSGDWETFVRSRLSTPPPPSPHELLQVRSALCPMRFASLFVALAACSVLRAVCCM